MKYKYLNNNSTYLVCVLEALLLIYFLLSLLDVTACRTTGSFGHSCAPELPYGFFDESLLAGSISRDLDAT